MRTVSNEIHAAVEIGAMLQGADMVKLAIAEMIRGGKNDLVSIRPEPINGFEWNWDDWNYPAVNTASIRGLVVDFYVSHDDLTWTGSVQAIDVLDKLVEMMEEK
jgi:hypothetical protein